MSKNQNNLFEGIIITHFINPHMFWFRPELSFLQNDNFYLLEREMNQYFLERKKGLFETNYVPKIREVVAVFMTSWTKWIRAVVERMVTLVNERPKVILWAIDLGFPMEVDVKWIKPLPQEIASVEFCNSYFGGLIDVVPSEQSYDFMANEAKNELAERWSERAVKEFENLIQKSAQIKFLPERIVNNQTFGRLEVTTFVGKKVDANDVLTKLNVAMISDNFFEDLAKCKTTKIERYLTNDGNLTFANLDYNKFSDFKNENTISEVSASTYQAKEVTQKVIEWGYRNNQTKFDCEPPNVLNNSVDSESDIFDSVSMFTSNTYKPCPPVILPRPQKYSVPVPTLCKPNKFNPIEDEDSESEINVMGVCGLNRPKLAQKYKSPPRLPRIEFESMGLSESMNTENSSVSNFRLKLTENKRKIQSKLQTFNYPDDNFDKSSSSSLSNSTESQSSIPQKLLDNFARQKQSILKKMHAKQNLEEKTRAESMRTAPSVPTTNGTYSSRAADECKTRATIVQPPVLNFVPAGFDQSKISEQIIDRFKDTKPPKKKAAPISNKRSFEFDKNESYQKTDRRLDSYQSRMTFATPANNDEDW